MVGYRPTTSALTRKKPPETFPIFIISIKSPESQMSDQPLCITGFKWRSGNSDAFSVEVPQLEIMGLPGTLWSRLWILSNRYKLPRLVVFFEIIGKVFEFFLHNKFAFVKTLKNSISFINQRTVSERTVSLKLIS